MDVSAHLLLIEDHTETSTLVSRRMSEQENFAGATRCRCVCSIPHGAIAGASAVLGMDPVKPEELPYFRLAHEAGLVLLSPT
jgi:hypothetical protein